MLITAPYEVGVKSGTLSCSVVSTDAENKCVIWLIIRKMHYVLVTIAPGSKMCINFCPRHQTKTQLNIVNLIYLLNIGTSCYHCHELHR